MSTLTKHCGKYGEKKCIVVFREVPNEPDNCLIVLTDTLESRTHDEFMNVVEGPEGQAANNLADILNRRQFSDGSNMLTALHYGKKLTKVPTVNVMLTPTPATKIALNEVNEELRKIEGGYVPPKTDESHQNDATTAPVQPEKPWVERSAEEATAYNQTQHKTTEEIAESAGLEPTAGDAEPSVAQSLLVQAELMRADAESMIADAEAKLAQAYEMDPSLKPKSKRGRKPKSETVAE